jgi:hypothetical protein
MLVFNPCLTSIRILLSTSRYMGDRPCPRCFIRKSEIPQLGSSRDDTRREMRRYDNDFYQSRVTRARTAIFQRGEPITGAAVERAVGRLSYTTTRVRADDTFM